MNLPTSARVERRILAICVITAGLYAANWLVQSALHGDGTVHAPHPAMSPAVASQLTAYFLVNACLFLTYGLTLSMCRRGLLDHGRARFWALAAPCLFYLGLAVTTPGLSQDVFSYMAHGFLGTLHGLNPFVTPAEAARNTLIGPHLVAAGWQTKPGIGITPYGVVWTQIEINIMRIAGTNVAVALLLFKGVEVAACLGTAYMIWLFLGRVAPSEQLLGTLAYLWNPLILIEFAGEGHNDGVMIFFATAALLACATSRSSLSIISQFCGIMTKYVSVVFLPAQLVYLWRSRRTVAQFAAHVAMGLVITGAFTAILYAPLWAGVRTFSGLQHRGAPISSLVPLGILDWILRRSPLSASAGTITVAVGAVTILLFAAWIGLRVRDPRSLARAFAWTAVVFVLIALPDYYAWYACMPITLLLMADSERFLWLVMVMAIAGRISGPFVILLVHHDLTMHVAKGVWTGAGTLIPLAALAVWVLRQPRRLAALLA